jgi:hypothetical protein
MVCCAFVFRIAVVAASFLSFAAPSRDHGQFGAEMGWVARSLALGLPLTGLQLLCPHSFHICLPPFSARVVSTLQNRPCHFVAGQPSLGAHLYSHLPDLKYAAGERPAQLAGWLWGIYPFAIYFSGTQVWDYALTSFYLQPAFASRSGFTYEKVSWFGSASVFFTESRVSPIRPFSQCFPFIF